MAVRVAEYLGQRTDALTDIVPQVILPEEQRNRSPLCPFNNQPCKKMKMARAPKPPICSLRKTDGSYYIVCENRLLSTDTQHIN